MDTYAGAEIKGEITGLVKSGENMICVADANQLMPDYETFGFAYISPQKLEDALGFAFYPQINVISDMEKSELENAVKDALRPYAPKAMKKSILEKLPFWDALPFATKWNVRDILRHKSRSAMTLVGVVGCMLLLVGGLGMKDTIMDTYDTFMEIMNLMVIIFVVAAIVLGTVVLYNLGVMSYVERYRELATLKVLGYRDKHIGKLLISQNIWLTIVGVIIGLPGGVGVLYVLITSLVSEYELCLTLGVLTYSVSILLTFGVSLMVGFMVARKNQKIDMVEALKGAE